MTCQELLDFLLAYLDKELEPEQRQVFESHLHCCPECVQYVRTYHLTVRVSRLTCATREELCDQAPEKLVQAILATLRGEGKIA